jgi:hypothetical protein
MSRSFGTSKSDIDWNRYAALFDERHHSDSLRLFALAGLSVLVYRSVDWFQENAQFVCFNGRTRAAQVFSMTPLRRILCDPVFMEALSPLTLTSLFIVACTCSILTCEQLARTLVWMSSSRKGFLAKEKRAKVDAECVRHHIPVDLGGSLAELYLGANSQSEAHRWRHTIMTNLAPMALGLPKPRYCASLAASPHAMLHESDMWARQSQWQPSHLVDDIRFWTPASLSTATSLLRPPGMSPIAARLFLVLTKMSAP